MQIDITGHHCDITPALRSYVNDKIGKLSQHFDQVIDTHVVLTVEKAIQKAEATLQVSGNKLFASADNQDMYAAIDSLADKLDRQVLKHKQKHSNHRA